MVAGSDKPQRRCIWREGIQYQREAAIHALREVPPIKKLKASSQACGGLASEQDCPAASPV
jgi:hypothetical protein